MTSEIDALLEPVAGSDDPCGPDQCYDAKRQELDKAFERDFSVAPSGQESDAPKVVWSTIINGLTDEFGRSKDLRVAKNLCLAGAAAKRLETVALGVGVLAALAEQFWERVHPQLEEYGLVTRVNVVSELNNRIVFLNPLRQVIVFADKRNSYSAETIVAFAKERSSNPEFELFDKGLAETGDAQLIEACEAFDGIAAALGRIAAAFAAKGGKEGEISFREALAVIAEMKEAAAAFRTVPSGAAAASDAGEPAGAADTSAPRIAGAVSSRGDVIRAIDAICAYYRHAEPSSPILPLMERAKSWVPMTFLQVLEDIEPDSVNAAKRVLLNKPSG